MFYMNNIKMKNMEKKQTAVEWYHDKWINFQDGKLETVLSRFEQAKQMEKEQMFEFARGFWYYGNGSDAPPVYPEDIEKYYNKTYKK